MSKNFVEVSLPTKITNPTKITRYTVYLLTEVTYCNYVHVPHNVYT